MKIKLSFFVFIIAKLAISYMYLAIGIDEYLYLISTLTLLLLFCFQQLAEKRAENKDYFLFQLPTMVVLLFVVLQVALPLFFIIFSFSDKGYAYFSHMLNEEDYLVHLNKALDYTFIGMFSFWLGEKWFSSLRKINPKILSVFTFSDKELSKRVLIILYFVGLLSRLLSIRLGLYGFTINTEGHLAYEYLAVPLSTLEKSCSLVFFIIAYNKNESHKKFLYFIILVELFFGFLSGMKSNVILVAIVLFMAEYLKSKKINYAYLVLSIFFTISAYAIIEPLRYIRHTQSDNASAGEYFSSLGKAYTLSKEISKLDDEEKTPLLTVLMSRFEISASSARAILYKDKVGLTNSDPDFFTHLTFVPFYAVIPRFIWRDKPKFSYGGWFNQKVMGGKEYDDEITTSSAAIGAVGYLYLAGGLFYIVLHFFIVGIIASFFTNNFLFSGNILNIIIFLNVIGMVGNIEVFSLYSFIFKTFPILIIGFKFLQNK